MLLLLLATLAPYYYGIEAARNAVFIFGGDVVFSGIIYRSVQKDNCTYNESFAKIKPYFRKADHLVVNLESPFGDTSNPPKVLIEKPKKAVHLLADTESVEALKYLDVSAVTVANNHFMDYGEKSMRTTLRILRENNIPYFGVNKGNSGNSKQQAVILSANGIKVGMVAYCMNEEGCDGIRNKTSIGPALYSKNAAVRDTKELRKRKVDVVIIYLHWGVEYTIAPLYHFDFNNLVEEMQPYVDVIIGSHPHVPQGHFYYKNTLVVPSLGNFLFPMYLTTQLQLQLENNGGKKAEKEWYKLTKSFKNPSAEGKVITLEFNKNGLVKSKSKYLTVLIDANERHCLYTKKKKKSKWTVICSKGDKQCFGDTKCNQIDCTRKKIKETTQEKRI